jgi:hypothetical protein
MKKEEKHLARSSSSINCTTKLKQKLEKEKYTPSKLLTGSWRFPSLSAGQFFPKTLQFPSIRPSYTMGS